MFSRIVNAIGFWTLVLPAFGLFLAGVLLPLYREHRQLQQTRSQMAEVVRQLEDVRDRRVIEREQWERGDPLLASRHAVERLGYTSKGDGPGLPVPVRPVPTPTTQPEHSAEGPIDRLKARLDQFGIEVPSPTGLSDTMASPTARTLAISLSAVLIVLAFLLFGRTPRFRSTTEAQRHGGTTSG